MLLHFLFSSILINLKTTIHNCNFSNGQWPQFGNESINYQISCPSYKIQRIDLKSNPNVKNISIFGDSNVIITCSSNENDLIQTVLSLYDKPTITFENKCNFNRIEIHNFPTFHLFSKSNISVNNLILTNHAYQFPFKYNHVIYSKYDPKRLKSQDNSKAQLKSQNHIYECNKNTIETALNDNYAIIKCGDLYEYTILYSMFSEKNFDINNATLKIKNQCSTDAYVNQNIEMFLPLIRASENTEVLFQKFPKLNAIENYTNEDIKGTWIQIGEDYRCQWGNESFQSEYENFFKRGWKKVCRSYTTFIYCCDSDIGPRKVIVISKWGFLAAIIFIICFIIALIVAFCIISYQKYNDSRKVS